MSTVERRVERFLQGGQSAFQLMSVENSRVMKEETRIRKSVELSLLLLKLRSLGWRSWSVTLTWPKSLTLLQELRPPQKEAPKVIYIFSETGVGKTTTTTRLLDRHSIRYYVKPSASKWWPGYDNQPVCILEEFTSCFPCTTFLQLCDPVQFQVEIKRRFPTV